MRSFDLSVGADGDRTHDIFIGKKRSWDSVRSASEGLWRAMRVMGILIGSGRGFEMHIWF